MCDVLFLGVQGCVTKCDKGECNEYSKLLSSLLVDLPKVRLSPIQSVLTAAARLVAAASIRFKIWGSWNLVKKIRFFKKHFRKFFIFFRQFHKKIDFSGQISEKFP